jgi:hypothetical protein
MSDKSETHKTNSAYICILKIPKPENEADQSFADPANTKYNSADRDDIISLLSAGRINL